MKSILLIITALAGSCFSQVNNPPIYIAETTFGTLSATPSRIALMVNATSQTKNAVLRNIMINCSVACTFTATRSFTLTGGTTITPARYSRGGTAVVSQVKHTFSGATSGEQLFSYTIQTGINLISLEGIELDSSAGSNITFSLTAASGTAYVSFTWAEH